MTSPTETEIQNIRLVLAGAKAPEEFGWGAADVAAWGELAAGDPVAFVTLGVWSRRVKEVDEETGEELHCKTVDVVPRIQRPAGVKAPKGVS